MPNDEATTDHYTHGNLLNAILDALANAGKSPKEVDIHDLAPVDEFHIGGREATRHLVEKLDISRTMHVLDIGCGLGGAARFVSETYGSMVSGIDLTEEFVETGNLLNEWVNLEDRINLIHGSALHLPFQDGSFSAIYMIHVGMNVEDKGHLFKEAYRVLTPGGRFGIYDIMALEENGAAGNELTFPVPWAASSETSFLVSSDGYKKHLLDAGFEGVDLERRNDFAKAFFNNLRSNATPRPPLGLHTLIGADMKRRFDHMIEAIFSDKVAPVEMIAHKGGFSWEVE